MGKKKKLFAPASESSSDEILSVDEYLKLEVGSEVNFEGCQIVTSRNVIYVIDAAGTKTKMYAGELFSCCDGVVTYPAGDVVEVEESEE